MTFIGPRTTPANMPKKKKSLLGALGLKKKETEEEKEARLAADRERKRIQRSQETPEQRIRRLAADRDHKTQTRAQETIEQTIA